MNSEYSASSTSSLKFCNLNTRSIKNKSADFVCYVKACAADIFAITETWFTDMDCAHRAEATPPDYKLYDHPGTGAHRRRYCIDVSRGHNRYHGCSWWEKIFWVLGMDYPWTRLTQDSYCHCLSPAIIFQSSCDYRCILWVVFWLSWVYNPLIWAPLNNWRFQNPCQRCWGPPQIETSWFTGDNGFATACYNTNARVRQHIGPNHNTTLLWLG